MENFQIEIQAYLNGELMGQALADFEKTLKTNQKVAREVAFFKKLQTTMQQADALEKSAIIAQIRATTLIKPDLDIESEYIVPQNALNSNVRWWALGGVILALIGFAVWQYHSIYTTKNKATTIAHQILIGNSPFENVISTSSNDTSLLAQAMRLYDIQQFQEAIPLLEKYQKRVSGDEFARLYLSICYLMTEQSDKAIASIQILIVSKDTDVATTSKWHLALAYLQKGQFKEAQPLLIELQNNVRFGNLAKEALNKGGSN